HVFRRVVNKRPRWGLVTRILISLKHDLEQRHIILGSRRSCLALEREYWEALEELALEDGWHNWRDFFYVNILPNRPANVSLASFVRRAVTKILLTERNQKYC
ncbi:MAG: ribbon-helix-helix domain-containing protein, partial [Pseudohongiellaceae bacterium]